VKFPDDYHAENLAGKEAVFHVKVNEIKVKELPELNDEFAKDVSEFETLEEFKKDIFAKLEENAKNRAKTEQENALIEKISDNAEVDIPEAMIRHETDEILKDMEMRLYYQGVRMEDYLRFMNKTIDQLREQNAELAAKRVKTRLVIEAIIKAENITADTELMEKEIEKLAGWANKPVEEYKETITDAQKEFIEQQVIYESAIKFLMENNKFE
ncbi:MAG TPA: trigger factor, partial [Clostridia bacterium]|nr:trigger factor [Clostridia bacterium]